MEWLQKLKVLSHRNNTFHPSMMKIGFQFFAVHTRNKGKNFVEICGRRKARDPLHHTGQNHRAGCSPSKRASLCVIFSSQVLTGLVRVYQR